MDAQKPKALAGEAVHELGKVRFPLVPEREKGGRGGWSLVVMLIEDQSAAFWVGLKNTDRSFHWQTGTSLQLGQKRTDCGVLRVLLRSLISSSWSEPGTAAAHSKVKSHRLRPEVEIFLFPGRSGELSCSS